MLRNKIENWRFKFPPEKTFNVDRIRILVISITVTHNTKNYSKSSTAHLFIVNVYYYYMYCIYNSSSYQSCGSNMHLCGSVCVSVFMCWCVCFCVLFFFRFCLTVNHRVHSIREIVVFFSLSLTINAIHCIHSLKI